MAPICARALGLLGNADSVGPLAAAVETGPTPLRINALLALAAVLDKNPGAALPADRRARVLALATDVNPNLAVPALGALRWYLRLAPAVLPLASAGGDKAGAAVAGMIDDEVDAREIAGGLLQVEGRASPLVEKAKG